METSLAKYVSGYKESVWTDLGRISSFTTWAETGASRSDMMRDRDRVLLHILTCVCNVCTRQRGSDVMLLQ